MVDITGIDQNQISGWPQKRAGKIEGKSCTAMARVFSLAAVASLGVAPLAAQAQQTLPQLAPVAPQKIGRTIEESGPPAWPKEPSAPAEAPNVLLIMTDDVGFGAASTFGGPIATPTLTGLAREGVRYNRFNTTAICSPTRAALLTGRNPHNVGMGNVANVAAGYPGYTSVIPKSAGTIAEILRQHGYNTAMLGKGHITPEWEMTKAGPFDRWPTGLGFEYFYGFLGADTDQWAPTLVEGTKAVEPPSDDPTYILDRDLADKAIKWMKGQHAVAPDKPFLMYYATGSTHAPHQAPKAWIDKFRGKFDEGWDKVRANTFARQKAMGIIPANAKLTPRPDALRPWSALSKDEKRVSERLMEAYAAQLAFADHQIGRIIDHLRKSGQLDNTMIIFIEGDNGASAEGGPGGLLYEQSWINGHKETLQEKLENIDEIGGPKSYNNYPAGWAWAMDTPFPYWKQIASQAGGVRNDLVIRWPGHIADNDVMRSQYAYVTDIFPTILDAVGVTAPKTLNGVAQQPVDGISLAYTFKHPNALSERDQQVYEMMENFGIYKDGWMAGVLPKAFVWETTGVGGANISPDERTWQLFNLDKDFSTANDFAETNPHKLNEMKKLFWQQAAENHILPLHSAIEGTEGRPSPNSARRVFTYADGATRIYESAAPPVVGKSFRIDADVVIPEGGANGVIVTHGGRFGGYGFYLKHGRPVFHYNTVGTDQYDVAAPTAIAPGSHRISVEFEADTEKPGTPGTATILVDGTPNASGRIARTIPLWISLTEGLDVGHDTITPINNDYTIPTSDFTGTLKQVTITVDSGLTAQ